MILFVFVEPLSEHGAFRNASRKIARHRVGMFERPEIWLMLFYILLYDLLIIIIGDLGDVVVIPDNNTPAYISADVKTTNAC